MLFQNILVSPFTGSHAIYKLMDYKLMYKLMYSKLMYKLMYNKLMYNN